MAGNSAPGVYTNLYDFSGRQQLPPTDLAAFVGGSKRGPVNQRTFITDSSDLDDFGDRDPSFSKLQYCVDPYLEEASGCYVTRVINGALWAGAYWTVDDPTSTSPLTDIVNFTAENDRRPMGKDDPMNNLAFNPETVAKENILGFFAAVDPGVWNDDIMIKIISSHPEGTEPGSPAHDSSTFWIEIYYKHAEGYTQPRERFLCSRQYRKDQNGVQMNIEDVLKKSKYVRFKNNPYCGDIPILNETFEKLEGGSDGEPPTSYQIAEAWELYSSVDDLDLNIMVNCGYADPIVHRKMDMIASNRIDTIAILDMPSDKQEVADAVEYKLNELNLSSYHSAIYCSDVEIYDRVTDNNIFVPVSGYVAQTLARTSNVRSAWFSNAGVRRGMISIRGTRHHYDQGARDAFTRAQINPIRKIPGGGYCIWDQLTTQTMVSSLQYLNVVRLSKIILTAGQKALRYKLFDPNDFMLWDYLKTVSDDFLAEVKRGRGVYAYKNICDDKTNTPESIANGDVILEQIYEPTLGVRRAHFIFNINRKGSTLTEIT